MSLLDGNEDVQVFPSNPVADDLGNILQSADGEPITVRGAFFPQSAELDAAAGQAAGMVGLFYCRDFPAGPWARVHRDGRDWDVIGEPKRHRRGSATAHDVVTLRTRERRA